MNFLGKVLSIVAFFGAFIFSNAIQAGILPLRPMIEIGAGAASLGNSSPIEGLFRVDLGVNTAGLSEQSMLIIARVKGSVATDLNQVSYMDFNFETLAYQQGVEDHYVKIQFLGGDLQRNLAINNKLTARITFLGLAVNNSAALKADELEFYFRLAASLIGLGYTERLSDGLNDLGYSPDLNIESGLRINKKYRVSIGAQLASILTKPYRFNDGTFNCTSFGQGPGGGTGAFGSTCNPEASGSFLESRYLARFYMNAIAEFTETLSLFGSAQYNIYSAQSDTNGFERSSDGALQLILGLNVSY